GNTLTLEDGGSVNLSMYLDNTDDQTLSLNVNTLELEDGGSVNLEKYLDNTDEQTLSEVLAEGNDAQGAVITGLGAPVLGSDAATKDYVDGLDTDDADNDPTNEMNTRFEVIGTNLEIEDGNGTLQVSLGDLGTDDQTLTLTGNILELADGGTVDLGIYLDNTDEQTLALTGTNLEISGGNSVDISGVNTDSQTLVLTGTDLEISGGNSVDLSSIDTNTDDQALTLTGNTLALEDGGSVDLAPSLDSTDDQDASEVDLDNSVDVDGDGSEEGTVEAVIQAIAPITSKAARIFYPPSIAIDASSLGTGRTINLYAQYTAQFGTPAVASAGAPAAIPTYLANELYYYVTYADPNVFGNMSINGTGMLTYDIIGLPSDYNALINVVFVVK